MFWRRIGKTKCDTRTNLLEKPGVKCLKKDKVVYDPSLGYRPIRPHHPDTNKVCTRDDAKLSGNELPLYKQGWETIS